MPLNTHFTHPSIRVCLNSKAPKSQMDMIIYTMHFHRESWENLMVPFFGCQGFVEGILYTCFFSQFPGCFKHKFCARCFANGWWAVLVVLPILENRNPQFERDCYLEIYLRGGPIPVFCRLITPLAHLLLSIFYWFQLHENLRRGPPCRLNH